MQSRASRTPGILARLRARLRGDRFMADAYPPVLAAPERGQEPVPLPDRGGKEA